MLFARNKKPLSFDSVFIVFLVALVYIQAFVMVATDESQKSTTLTDRLKK